MTFLIPYLAAVALASPPSRCPLPERANAAHRVFTNADLELMTACRYETGALSEPGVNHPAAPSRKGPSARSAPNPAAAGSRDLEADWRARWRAVDQKVRRLRRDADELRQEAAEAPRDAKKRQTGRRSPSLLLRRAQRLEAEAKELDDEFQERARREGALPGWLRVETR